MGLTKYKEKRNFNDTPEPGAVKKKSGKSLAFVVQRHYASHLHYDFRLEMEGVLKSWAVPKGPSMNPGDKRLAMMVEDHPYDYRKFAGTIPEGNYGAGEVEIWDEGTYTSLIENEKTTVEKELLKELKTGDLKIVLKGEQLKGAFALVKMKNAEQDNAWLLIKKKDDFAIEEFYDAAEHKSLIVKKPKEDKKKTSEKPVQQARPVPIAIRRSIRSSIGRVHVKSYIKPILAKKVDEPFDSDEWIFEIKWDGYRAIAETGKELKLYSRNGISFLNRYPDIEDELKTIKEDLVLDGEIVAMDENGIPSFQLIQNIENYNTTLIYYVFDILKKGKKDLTDLPLLERKEILKQTLKDYSFIRYSDHIVGIGKQFFELSKQRNLEGIMAKKADSTYSMGARTGNWLKIKNHQGQEAVIAGFTAPRGSRKSFGALVLGIYEGKELKYCGHTGTGFGDANLKQLHSQLLDLVQDESPFKENVKTNMPVTWVKPELVCNVKYSEMTKDGIMRHPVYLGLREDKKPEEVVNEEKVNMKKTAAKTASAKPKKEETENNYDLKIGKYEVKLTNKNKVYFPNDKITKGDIIQYYQSISEYILPYLKDRPQSLLRNPNGIAGPGFFHKDAGDEGPAWIKSVKVQSDSGNKEIDYILCNDAATLAYLNNLGCIEINPWHSRVKALDKPDYFALDIDPSPKNTFEEVIEAALAVKEILDKAGAESYCKTSGATGLHIYIPLGGKYTYDQVKDFANVIAIMASELVPGFTTLERNLKKRGDKIYMDYLQNRRGQTLASVYSARPKPGATVSTPLLWEEVKPGLSPSDYTIFNIKDRLKEKGDLFQPVLGKGIDLRKCIEKLSG